MNRALSIVLGCVAGLSWAASVCAGEAGLAGLSVDFVLESKYVDSEISGRLSVVEGTLVLRNTGDRELSVAHPRNRWGVSFLVLDSTGAVLMPIIPGHGDRGVDRNITIQPKGEFRETFRSLTFVSGRGFHHVYTFQPGQTYRVVAVYRPRGPEGPSFTVGEKVVKVLPESK